MARRRAPSRPALRALEVELAQRRGVRREVEVAERGQAGAVDERAHTPSSPIGQWASAHAVVADRAVGELEVLDGGEARRAGEGEGAAWSARTTTPTVPGSWILLGTELFSPLMLTAFDVSVEDTVGGELDMSWRTFDPPK